MPSDQGSAHNPALERVAGMNMDGSSDRPGSSQDRSRPGSTVTSSQQGDPRSRAGSASGQGNPGPFHRGMGFDPAKPRNQQQPMTPQDLIGKRVDLPPEAFKKVSQVASIVIMFTDRAAGAGGLYSVHQASRL